MTWLARLREEDGNALVEVALALPLLMTMVAGTVDFGLYEERKMQAVEAANAAAGYGAVSGNQLNTAGMQSAASAASPSLSGLTVSAQVYWVCSPGGAQVASSDACSNGENPLQYVLVTTAAVVNAPMPLASLGRNMHVTGQAAYRVRWKPS